MEVTIDGYSRIINTSKPIQADDCLLFQSRGLPRTGFHDLEIQNIDGGELYINRIEAITLSYFRPNMPNLHARTVVSIVIWIVFAILLLIVASPALSQEKRRKIKRSFGALYL